MARKKKVVEDTAKTEIKEEAIALDSSGTEKVLIDEAPKAEKVLIDEKVEPSAPLIEEKPAENAKEILVETPAEIVPGITIENIGYMTIDRSKGIKSDGETLKRTITYPDGRVRIMYETLVADKRKS